jgi:Uma2 family endonuclease
MTPVEYHTFLRDANEKYEYIRGKVVKMAGASFSHNLIAFDVGFALESELIGAHGPCVTLGSDQKVFVTRHIVYLPDVTVVCGTPEIDEDYCLHNPTVIVEVLSPSTAAVDEGDKFRDYRSIPSLRHYILVEQDAPTVTHYARTDHGPWSIVGDFTELSDSITMTLGEATVSLPLSHIYRRISFTNTTESLSSEA